MILINREKKLNGKHNITFLGIYMLNLKHITWSEDNGLLEFKEMDF